MKQTIKNLIAKLLAMLSKAIVKKYTPKVIMVTGSVGKTSTKDAIAAVLSCVHTVRASEKSFNSEFGVPLTIIGEKNPWNNIFGWLRVLESGVALLLFKHSYPEYLVLEVGADKPGDLARILDIVTPNAVVVTQLPDVPVHVEAYDSTQQVRIEEFSPVLALPANSIVIINSEDTHANDMVSGLGHRISTFGFAQGSDVHIQNVQVSMQNGKLSGMSCALSSLNFTTEFMLHGALGKHLLYAPAAAYALGKALNLSNEDLQCGLDTFTPPAGRMRLFDGRHDSTIIDDTYNSSPIAVREALDILSLLTNGRRIAVLGDMMELGVHSMEEHEKVGELVAKCSDAFFAVGVRMKDAARVAIDSGLDASSVFMYSSSREALADIEKFIKEGDNVLVKGSQSMRMEHITKVLLKNKEDAKSLVRQEKEWKKR